MVELQGLECRWNGAGSRVITTAARCRLGKPQTPQGTADPNRLLDIGQAAEFLNVSETSLRRWTNSGRLPCLRVGQRRERRFRRGDLLAFLESQPSDINAGAGEAGPVKHGDLWDLAAGPMTVIRRSHLCGLYASGSGRIMLAVPFLLDGLHEGSLCFLVASLRARNKILKSLTKKRPSLQEDIDAGRLIASDYHASPRAQFSYFRGMIDEKAAEGAQSFRILGDSWGFRSQSSEEAIIELEAAYDRHIARKYPVVTMCLYDVRKFSGVEILNALKGHVDMFRYPVEKALA